MRATVASRTLLIASALAVIALPSGCGSSKPDPAREARLVAEANALCASILHRAHPSQTKQREAQQRLVTVAKALSVAAAYLSTGKSLNEARAKLRALHVEIGKLSKSGAFSFSGPPDYIERSYRLQVQIYDDYKALGLARCLGPPPRPPISG
jgi:hypothetical protein